MVTPKPCCQSPSQVDVNQPSNQTERGLVVVGQVSGEGGWQHS